MKFKLVLSLALILMATTTAQADTTRVCDAKDPVIAKYFVHGKPDGCRYVYSADQAVIVKYIVKPIPGTDTHHVYDSSWSLLVPKATTKGVEVK